MRDDAFIRRYLRFCRRILRRAAYSVRFLGRPICVDATAWVSWKSTLHTPCGGSIRIGRNCEIHPYSMLLTHGGDIRIGDDCSVNPFTIVYGAGGTTIGKGVRIAAHSMIVPENHNPGSDALPVIASGKTRRGVLIEDNVWIGSGVCVLDGVRIGRNSVIGAGSVVTRSVPNDVTVVGIPARVIKSRSDAGAEGAPTTAPSYTERERG